MCEVTGEQCGIRIAYCLLLFVNIRAVTAFVDYISCCHFLSSRIVFSSTHTNNRISKLSKGRLIFHGENESHPTNKCKSPPCHIHIASFGKIDNLIMEAIKEQL